VAIFTKRNALVGYLTLKSYSRARRRWGRKERRSTWKLATYLVLGLVSVGILAALAAILLRRQGETPLADEAGEALEEAESGVDPAADGPVVSTEPIQAT
jgi:Tfp pilus assembly protein PilN